MKSFFAAAGLLLVTCISHAQTMDATSGYNNKMGAEAYVGIGAGYNNFKNLNTALSGENLPGVPKFNIQSIAEIDLRFTNFLVGINADMGGSFKRTGSYNLTSAGYGGVINVGYNIINAKDFHFAPQVGIGLVSNTVNITQRNGIDSFNEVLTGKNAININQTTGVLDFALRFDFADYTKGKFPMALIKVGYRYGLGSRGWGIDENSNSTIDDSPKDRISQGYVLLCLGMSRLHPKR